MPARNATKEYLADSYYHLYNRGVEKRKIFLDTQDIGVFLSYLKEYLLPKDQESLRKRLADSETSYKERDRIIKQLRMNNFSETITLLAYCLMSNHFHFMIKQKDAGTIDVFMNSLGTRYTMYFNKKYKRVGSLYQGVYKAVMVKTEQQFLHLSRYIHRQALDLQGDALQERHPSSFFDFLGVRQTAWVKPQEMMNYFVTTNKHLSYESFVKQDDNQAVLKDIMIEDEN